MHEPSLPQVEVALVAHWLSGSWPVGTLVHVPSVPGRAQDWHVPVHADAQQIPCAHRLVMHSPAAAHAIPVVFLVHAPAMHTLGARQSPSVAHDVLQTFIAQAKGPHDDAVVA